MHDNIPISLLHPAFFMVVNKIILYQIFFFMRYCLFYYFLYEMLVEENKYLEGEFSKTFYLQCIHIYKGKGMCVNKV
jgi:hypothetical protein